MKKIKFLLLIVISLFIIPNVYAANDVKIESIDVLEKSEDVDVLSPASFDGLSINFDVRFVKKNDYIKYKVIVKNESDKDYKITNTTKFKDGDYIKYEYSFTKSNIVQAHSKQTMIITMTYINLVSENQLDDSGKFVEKKNMIVSLAQGNFFNNNPILNNPQTSSTLLVLIVIITFIVCLVSIIGIRKNNSVKTMLLIIGFSFLFLPISILAIESLQIKVNSKVTLAKEIEFCIWDNALTTSYTAEVFPATTDYEYNLHLSYRYKALLGMTWEDFRDSKYFNQVGNETPKDIDYYQAHATKSSLSYYFEDIPNRSFTRNSPTDDSPIEVFKTDRILPCSKATYSVNSNSYS